jgi:putative transposase
MVQKYIIARTRSLLSAPVLLVKKKDNNYRVVVDYTKLNEKTENDDFPVTTPRTTSETLCSARYYSSLDLGLGYLQEESTRRMLQKQDSTQE